MIKTPLSTVLGGAFWTPGCTVVGSTPNLDRQIAKLFSNGEQGFYYDPNDLNTMFQDAAGTIPVTAAGQPVGLMRDKSGRNNHAFQTVSASRPILQRNATTGAYYLAFDGADDFLQTNSIDFTATDKLNLFAGLRKSGDTVVGVLAETSANANNNVGAFYVLAPSTAGVANSSVIVRAATTFMSTAYTNPALAVGIPYLLRFKSDIATKTLELSVNANLVSAWNKSDVGYSKMGNYPLYIGRRSTGVFPFNGHLYSLIGIGRLTTDSETIALEKSIAKNTGVTLSV